MNITLTLSDSQQAGLTYATLQRNAANPDAAPMTEEEFAVDLLQVKCSKFSAQQASVALQALSPDPRFLDLCIAAVSATSDKQDAAIAAAMNALQ